MPSLSQLRAMLIVNSRLLDNIEYELRVAQRNGEKALERRLWAEHAKLHIERMNIRARVREAA